MANKIQYDNNTSQQFIPLNVYNVTGSSGTYQIPAADIGKLHVVRATAAVYVNRGTGASVSVTVSNGTLIDFPVFVHACDGGESIGWVAATGTVTMTVGTVSR